MHPQICTLSKRSHFREPNSLNLTELIFTVKIMMMMTTMMMMMMMITTTTTRTTMMMIMIV